MPKIITSLTQKQIDQFPKFVQKWVDIGLSTKPANRKAAESAIIEIYKAGGLAPPRKIVWCGSPFSQGLTRALVLNIKPQLGASVGDSVGNSVRDSVRTSVNDPVRHSVSASVGNSVRDSVSASVWDSVSDSVWDSVSDSVSASVWASVWASMRDSMRDSVNDSVRRSVGNCVDRWNHKGIPGSMPQPERARAPNSLQSGPPD